ncbi:MAG: tol-pal system-associated acyl-CoA thioesterase [Rhodovulum sp.]|jgi:acyl-CoA thioester hydrolase|uniref:tol-pal system-associated acyl-CoA thioesterase n=1 Tax=Rhodovulum sp. FJ3 TaxID=3079053 RepID=UPI000C09C062|nr:tol-pal system-associated acyl-CoA thioesterase [Rhodovulum sp. FJ3]MAY33715.1 tol-pal system-associated acyl-CoA thioesterase [Rhodovulum sp.]MCI5086018.1 tol-pal system-associated acyl-CoA thioesterase [Rhodovulum sp.]MDV4167187.1 tol-pal system-associated acyl-CoA thioesterase [Rhodovulum sp. FJ3]|tara:strand:- start:816 stop:1211 length:396 start_codon:yes stop_codon:yes gene_type:complete
MKAHHHQVRVYYEDTDMAGIVYYANYLKFIERGRSEWVRSIGIDQARLKKEGMFFAVRKVDADFLRPAVYDDVLTVETVVESQTGARLNLIQRVLREGEEIFTAKVMIVSLSVDGYPVALPADIRQLLTEN